MVDETVNETLSGPKILLNGEAGTGKTRALGTLVDWAQAHGFRVFYLDIENSIETLQGYWLDRGLPIPDCFHYCQLRTTPVNLIQMLAGAKETGELSYELLTKKIDTTRAKNNAFHRILTACADFKDIRTGKSFGPVDAFGPKDIFMLDSFTELSNAAAKMVIGVKSTMAPPDYGVAQNHLMNFLRLCHSLSCTFVMTCHPVRDKDEISGAIKTTIKTVGTAIQAEIPPLFSEVIYTVREGDKFYWDTAAYGVVTKTRSLGFRSKIEPDFASVMDTWLKRNKV